MLWVIIIFLIYTHSAKAFGNTYSASQYIKLDIRLTILFTKYFSIQVTDGNQLA